MYPFYGDVFHEDFYSMGEFHPHTVGTGGGGMKIEEIMKFVTDRYCNKTRVQSVSLMNGSWLVKIVELEKLK